MDQTCLMQRVRHVKADGYISAIIGVNEVKPIVQHRDMICP